jgi:aspartate/methionine/tyrosine aminotransferase
MAHLARRIQQMAPSPTIAMTKRAFALKAAGVDAEVLARHPDVVVLTDEIYEHLVSTAELEEGLERIARFCAGLR